MRDLFSFSLPWHLRLKLLRCGITTAEQIRESTAEGISSCARVTLDDAKTLLRLVGSNSRDDTVADAMSIKTDAHSLMTAEENDQPVRTLCHTLDEILNGGIPIRTISELCGVSGTGKTQLCLQLAVNVQVPKVLGGLEGEALFIDTDNGFNLVRITQVAMAAVEHFQEVAAFESNPACLREVGSFSVNGILKGIHYIRCDNKAQLSAIVNNLGDFLEEHKKIRLVIVDSIAFHMTEFDSHKSYVKRTGYLFNLSQQLSRVAIRNSLAVVLTNQMTTRISATRDNSYLVPALGENWSHACPLRLLFLNENNQRTAKILKSSCLPKKTALFKISSVGIRDVDGPNAEQTVDVASNTLTGFLPQQKTIQFKRTVDENSVGSISKRPRFNN